MNVEQGARDRRVAAVCGLSCEVCTVYIASQEDPARLARLAGRFGVAPDELHCDGCRSDRRSVHCRTCEFVACAEGRGIDFCGQCADYPCAR